MGGDVTTVIRLGRMREAERFLDFARRFPSVRLHLVTDRAELAKARMSLALSTTGGERPRNLRVVRVDPPRPLGGHLGRLGGLVGSRRLMAAAYRSEVLQVRRLLDEARVVWIGESDFDAVFQRVVAVRDLAGDRVRIVANLKETRYERKAHERLGLELSDGLVFPHDGYREFFEKLYGLRLPPCAYGDPNWPPADKVARVDGIGRRKKRDEDGRIHVAILSGRMLSDPLEARSGDRYDMVDVVRALAGAGLAVHVHASRIVPDRRGVDRYAAEAARDPLVHVHDPLELGPGCEDYDVLARYDLGFLHPGTPPENEALWRFQRINVPHRLWEYLLGRLVPVVPRDALPAVRRASRELSFPLVEYADAGEIGPAARAILERGEDAWEGFEMPTYDRYCECLRGLLARLDVDL